MSPVNTRREPTKPVIKKRPLTQTKSQNQNDFSILNVDLKLSKEKQIEMKPFIEFAHSQLKRDSKFI